MPRQTIPLALSALIILAAVFAQDTSTGLAICYKMDEVGASVLTNSVSGGPNGTLGNSPVWTNGVSGGGLYFQSNVTRPYVSATFDYGLMRSNGEGSNWTVAVWFKTLDWPMRTTECYLWGRIGSHAGLALHSNAGLVSLNYSFRTAGTTSNINLVTNIRNGSWYHAAVVYSNRTMKMYLNGVLVGQKSIGAGDFSYNYSTAFSLGWIGGGQYGFSGTLDDFRVYTRPLSALDVGALASPSATMTNVTSGQEIIPGTVLRGTCTPGLSFARLILSNATSEQTNMDLQFDSTTSWWANPTLPLGNFSALLVVSNSNNLGSTTGPIPFTVTTFSTLTVRTVDTDGAAVYGSRLYGPSASGFDGLRTNDTSGEVRYQSVKVGRVVGLTNFAPQSVGKNPALTNFTMPGSDTTVVWVVDLSAAVASNTPPAANPALVIRGRTGLLRLKLEGPTSSSTQLTVSALRLSGGLRVPLYDGYLPMGTAELSLPVASIPNTLSPGVWIVESLFRTSERDEQRGTVRRQMLFITE